MESTNLIEERRMIRYRLQVGSPARAQTLIDIMRAARFVWNETLEENMEEVFYAEGGLPNLSPYTLGV